MGGYAQQVINCCFDKVVFSSYDAAIHVKFYFVYQVKLETPYASYGPRHCLSLCAISLCSDLLHTFNFIVLSFLFLLSFLPSFFLFQSRTAICILKPFLKVPPPSMKPTQNPKREKKRASGANLLFNLHCRILRNVKM